MIPKLWLVVVAAFATLSFCPDPARAADCTIELKPTDGYKELSGKLKCLEDRIKILESGGGGHTMPSALPAASTKSGARVNSGGVDISLRKCARQGSHLECWFALANPTTEDKKICFQKESRIVSDKGTSFAEAYFIGVGATQQTVSSKACDIIPPKVTASAYVGFYNGAKQVDAKLQLVRLNCGGGCVLNAYDVPVE